MDIFFFFLYNYSYIGRYRMKIISFKRLFPMPFCFIKNCHFSIILTILYIGLLLCFVYYNCAFYTFLLCRSSLQCCVYTLYTRQRFIKEKIMFKIF